LNHPRFQETLDNIEMSFRGYSTAGVQHQPHGHPCYRFAPAFSQTAWRGCCSHALIALSEVIADDEQPLLRAIFGIANSPGCRYLEIRRTRAAD